MSKSSPAQHGFVHILLILLLLVGMGIGVYLVTSKGFFSFKSKASSDAVSFEGPTLTYRNNQYYTTSLQQIKLKLISPIVAPASTPVPIPTRTPVPIPTRTPVPIPTRTPKPLTPATNLLINGDLETGSISPWQRLRPADLTTDQALISTHETNWSVYNNPSLSASGNYYLAFNCGNNTSCIPGQSVYQDVNVSNLTAGTTIVYGGKFAVAKNQNPDRINFSVFEIGPASGIIAHSRREPVTEQYNLIQDSFALNKDTKTLRYQFYLDTPSTFRVDDVFLGPGSVLGISKTATAYEASYTTSFRWAKSPTDLDKAPLLPYDSEPKIIDYTFTSTAPNTSETVFVEFVGQGGEKVRKQTTITYLGPADTEAALPFKERFDGSFSGWMDLSEDSADQNSITVDPTRIYAGTGSLKMHLDNGAKALKFEKTFSSSTNIVSRIFFYDNMQSPGTMFIIKQDPNIYTGLGVHTPTAAANYVMRINNTFVDTYFPRSLGWHMFELIVTPQGTYGKVDNFLIRTGNNDRADSAQANTNQTSASVVDLVSSWGLTGDAFYDELSIDVVKENPWREQIISVLGDYYATWNNVNLTALLTDPGKGDGVIRPIVDQALAFYLYGKNAGNTEAKNKGLNLFKQLINSSSWNLPNRNLDVFPGGTTQAELAYTAYVLWNDLDESTRRAVNTLIGREARRFLALAKQPATSYIDKEPFLSTNTQAEENGSVAEFLADAVNFFPNAFGSTDEKTQIENKARCFAYNSITRSTDPASSVCPDIKTVTVADDFTLANHGDITAIYGFSPIHQLGRAALSYHLTGKPIPDEFRHNVKELYENFIKQHIDFNTYHFVGVKKDWCCGVKDSLFNGVFAVEYLQALGANLGFSMQDFMNKRSLFFSKIVSNWVPLPQPTQITGNFIGIREKPRIDSTWNTANLDSYNWVLDTDIAGSANTVALLFDPATVLSFISSTNQPSPTPNPTQTLSRPPAQPSGSGFSIFATTLERFINNLPFTSRPSSIE